MKQFEVGKTYTTRSICSHDTVIACTIEKRTAKTVHCTVWGRLKMFRLGVYDDAEIFSPWGNHSMSPTIRATDSGAV